MRLIVKDNPNLVLGEIQEAFKNKTDIKFKIGDSLQVVGEIQEYIAESSNFCVSVEINLRGIIRPIKKPKCVYNTEGKFWMCYLDLRNKHKTDGTMRISAIGVSADQAINNFYSTYGEEYNEYIE